MSANEPIQDPHKDDSLADFQLESGATQLQDSVACLNWAPMTQQNPKPTMFAAGTWDGWLKIYNVEQKFNMVAVVQKYQMKMGAPIMGVCWNPQANGLYVGCADNSVKAVDLSSNKTIDIGKHQHAVKEVFFAPNQNTIISCSYDKTIQFWQMNNPNPCYTINLPQKVYCADFQETTLAAGLSDQKILLFDLSAIENRLIVDCDMGKFSQIQSIAINHDRTIMGVGSIDGRGNLSSILRNDLKLSNLLTFKSGKIMENGKSILYPINSVGFNIRYKNSFFTAGSQGIIRYWDFYSKSKTKHYSNARNPVSCAKTSPSGDLMAYALGNDWHMGHEGVGLWKSRILVHSIRDDDIKKSP